MSALAQIAKRMAPVLNQATTHQPVTRARNALVEQFMLPSAKPEELSAFLKKRGSRDSTISSIMEGLEQGSKLPINEVIDRATTHAPKYTVQRGALARPAELKDIEEAYQALTLAGGAPDDVYEAVTSGMGLKAMPYEEYQRLTSTENPYFNAVVSGADKDNQLFFGKNFGNFRGSLSGEGDDVTLHLESVQAGRKAKDQPGVYEDLMNAAVLQALQSPEISRMRIPNAKLIGSVRKEGLDFTDVYDRQIPAWLRKLNLPEGTVQSTEDGWTEINLRGLSPELIQTRAKGGLMRMSEHCRCGGR